MSRSSIRVTRSRGRRYLQEVTYTWDPQRKRGTTTVLRHLGPLEPLDKKRNEDPELREARIRLRIQWQEEAHRKHAKEMVSLVPAGNERGGKSQSPRVTRRPSLTPTPEFKAKVLAALAKLSAGGNRKDVFSKMKSHGEIPAGKEDDFQRLVGFSLTVLAREGILVVAGDGRRGNPQRFSLKEPEAGGAVSGAE